MTHTVNIDTLELTAEFFGPVQQREVRDSIINALLSSYSNLYISQSKKNNKNIFVSEVFTAGTKILEIKSGSYPDKVYSHIKGSLIYYVSVEIAGLKSYDEKADAFSHECLRRVCAYLNTNMIQFLYTAIDVCVDMRCPFENVYAFINKRAPHVQRYRVGEPQMYATTHYLEKHNHTHNSVSRRSYFYAKGIKEEQLNLNITRFEMKLQSRMFRNYNNSSLSVLAENLDKYHILYFPTVEEKYAALSIYTQYEDTIRRRDLHKLGLDRYRVIPDTRHIEWFLIELRNVHEHDLGLHIAEVNNDWLDYSVSTETVADL